VRAALAARGVALQSFEEVGGRHGEREDGRRRQVRYSLR